MSHQMCRYDNGELNTEDIIEIEKDELEVLHNSCIEKKATTIGILYTISENEEWLVFY